MNNLISFFSVNTSLNASQKNKDIYAFCMGVISQFFWAMSNIQLKTYRVYYPNNFSTQSVTFWRSFTICLIAYISINKKNQIITPISEIKYKFWFFLRNIGNYIFLLLWIVELIYFRVSTAQCIANCSPIVVLILSSLVLKETFYLRYVIGVLVSLIGTIMIILNDKKDTNANLKNKTVFDICIGLCIALSHMTFLAFSHFGLKMLCKEHMTPEVQNFYLGLFNTIPAFFVMLLEKNTGIDNLIYVLYACSNGIIFYLANYFMAEALNIMEINKFIPMNYLRIVFIFIFGFLILGEHVYFTDFIGSAFIIGFQVYNVSYPVQKYEDNDLKAKFIDDMKK